MSDTEGLAYITCLYDDGRPEQCGAMVEDTDDARREHRRWHAQQKQVADNLRAAVKDRPTSKEFRAAIDSIRDELRAEMVEAIGDVHRDVNRIEIPAPVLPVKRSESGWSDDDEPDDLPPVDIDDPTVSGETVSNPAAVADAVAAFTPAIDRPGERIDPVTGLPIAPNVTGNW